MCEGNFNFGTGTSNQEGGIVNEIPKFESKLIKKLYHCMKLRLWREMFGLKMGNQTNVVIS